MAPAPKERDFDYTTALYTGAIVLSAVTSAAILTFRRPYVPQSVLSRPVTYPEIFTTLVSFGAPAALASLIFGVAAQFVSGETMVSIAVVATALILVTSAGIVHFVWTSTGRKGKFYGFALVALLYVVILKSALEQLEVALRYNPGGPLPKLFYGFFLFVALNIVVPGFLIKRRTPLPQFPPQDGNAHYRSVMWIPATMLSLFWNLVTAMVLFEHKLAPSKWTIRKFGLAGLAQFGTAAVFALISVRRSLRVGNYAWKWRALAIGVVSTAIADFVPVYFVTKTMRSEAPYSYLLLAAVHVTGVGAACLGLAYLYVYLNLASRDEVLENTEEKGKPAASSRSAKTNKSAKSGTTGAQTTEAKKRKTKK